MLNKCPNVPNQILNPINTWNNHLEYKHTAEKLAKLFQVNFSQISNSKTSRSTIDSNTLKAIEMGGPRT